MKIDPRKVLSETLPPLGIEMVGFSDPMMRPTFLPSERARGRVVYTPIFPGIALSHARYLGEYLTIRHEDGPSRLAVEYCTYGRAGWKLRGGSVLYYGAQDLLFHRIDLCADSRVSLPLGYYESYTFLLDLDILARECPPLAQQGGFSAQAIDQRYCMCSKPVAIPADAEVMHIFEDLNDLDERDRPAAYERKAQELLLFLSHAHATPRPELPPYAALQTNAVQQVHDTMTANLRRRFTIETLSQDSGLNASTLKSVFKAMYGLPIATYMKEYRIRRAQQLLRDTDASIAEVAATVGYETQGKFANTFRIIVGAPPTEYRRAVRG